MNTATVFTERVLRTLSKLPENEQSAISAALTAEFILGRDPDEGLSPFQSILYTMIRTYVGR